MESNMSTGNSVTLVKYEKTSCYFCDQWLDQQSFKEHIIHCGQVLEQCPNSCNAYIQRKRMRSHLTNCPKVMAVQKNEQVNGNRESDSPVSWREHENRVAVLEQDVSALRSVLNEEIKQRLHLITDVGSLRKHNQIADEWTKKVGEVLGTLKKCVNEETTTRNHEIQKCYTDIKKLLAEAQALEEWKITTSTKLERLQSQSADAENIKRDVVEIYHGQNELSDSMYHLKADIQNLKLEINELTTYANQTCGYVTERLNRLEKDYENRIAAEMTKFNELESMVASMRNDFETRLISSTELYSKQMKLDCEVKGMKSIVCETEDRCNNMEKKVTDIGKLVHETSQALSDFEIHLSHQEKLMGIWNTKGHLIWRIPQFSAKMKEAKEFDTYLQSPIFCNKQYGYHLRLIIYLNGIGTWKGRNVIASITVVTGDYDSLLHWPCKLQGEIILRDQSEDLDKAQDYVKTTVVKKRNEDFDAKQYIYIPHKVFNTLNYVRDDAVIFEVRLIKNKFYT